MLIVRCSTRDNRNSLNRIQSGVDAAKAPILDRIGKRLTGLARVYFDNLSKGGASFTGRRWAALKLSTVAKRQSLARRGKLQSTVATKGVVTGEMRESLRYDASQTAIKLYYAADYSRYFNRYRRMLPTRLPRVWRDACDLEVIKYFQNLER